MNNTTRASLVAAVAVSAMVIGACSSSPASNNSTDNTQTTTAGGETPTDDAQPAEKGAQPDVNGDGQVVIGMMSPGDTHDNGYYQSFVDDAKAYADGEGWKVIVVDKIPTADAETQALNLCAQGVDLVAIGAGELVDALNAATDPSCANTEWYMDGGNGVPQTPYFAQSGEDVKLDALAWGYAAGLAMQKAGTDKAGFITGAKADFSTITAAGFRAGIKVVLPDATLVETYTGDFDDSAKAKEAAQADIAQGVGFLFPYLGGATDAVGSLANENDIMTMTPGTDRCDDPTTPYSISTISNAGARFGAALDAFKSNSLKMGENRVWVIGVDPTPTIIMCGDLADLQPQVDDYMKKIGTGEIDVDAVTAEGNK